MPEWLLLSLILFVFCPLLAVLAFGLGMCYEKKKTLIQIKRLLNEKGLLTEEKRKQIDDIIKSSPI